MKKLILFFLLVLIGGLIIFLNPFGAPGTDTKTEIVTIDSDSRDAAALQLEQAGIVKSFSAFNLALSLKNVSVKPGGYYFSKNMDAWQVIKELGNGPDLKSITIREGLRKEQIGELLQSTFGWTEQERIDWDQIHSHDDYFEGVYFPDTYLIPVKEKPEEVAARMINNFNDKFSVYSEGFAKKDIKWATGIKLASIIQRESAGTSDMHLISGILWNRLLASQKLDIDATVQYALGGPGDWWPALSGSDIKNADSPYNTYDHTGLPPTPISNPGTAAIEAALNPQDTQCLYYLHSKRQIYCSKTYEGHLENIEKYLN